MNWRLVLALSLFALCMAFATVWLIPSKVEPAFWLPIFIACAVLIAQRAPGRFFLHGLALGLVNCLWITSAHVIFFDAYVARHAEEAASFGASRGMMLAVGPVIGLVSGCIIGLFALLAAKLLRTHPA